MIKTNETKRTRGIIVPQYGPLDTYRSVEVTRRIFGIVISRRVFTHHMDYKQAILESKQIGFLKPIKDEKTEEESD